MEEIWKDIPDYEGLYQVSNLGKVKSLPKQWISGNGGIRIQLNEIIMSEQNSSFNVFRYQRDKPDKNTVLHEKYDTNLEKLKHYKNELEKILEEQFINNKVYLLKNILCIYIFLEKKFNIIRKKM
jgi:hypothetical protein